MFYDLYDDDKYRHDDLGNYVSDDDFIACMTFKFFSGLNKEKQEFESFEKTFYVLTKEIDFMLSENGFENLVDIEIESGDEFLRKVKDFE